MKILFYNHTGTVSGAERVLSMILAHLDRDQYEPVVVCPSASRMMELATQANVRTGALTQLEARFTWRLDRVLRYLASFASVIRRARQIVIEEEPDLVHANSIRAGLVMSAATFGLGVPIIWHAHDILPRHPLSSAVRLFAALRSHNHILAVSNAVAVRFRGTLLRLFARRVPITVVHNAVDLDRFRPDPESRRATRRALGLGEAQPLLAAVGQLTPRKGQLELIEAFANIAAEIPNSTLLIIGAALFNRDEDYAKQLSQTVAKLALSNRVRFLGPRDDVPRLLQALDVLVVNSHEEPFALTVLEGLASGSAVLATAVGGTPEMIRHGANGWLVKARDQKSLRDGLLTLLRDPNLRRRIGSQGRRDAAAHFTIGKFIDEIFSLYRIISECTKKPQGKTAQPLQVKLTAD